MARQITINPPGKSSKTITYIQEILLLPYSPSVQPHLASTNHTHPRLKENNQIQGMGPPWEIFSVVVVTLLFGGSFCYYMSQKQKKYFADEAAATAANRAFLVVLPMSSHPTSDTLPIYSVAVLAPAVTILPSALPPPPPSTAAASSSLPSSSSLSSPLASSLSSTVQVNLSGGTGGPGGPGVESHLPPPPSYQPIAVPR